MNTNRCNRAECHTPYKMSDLKRLGLTLVILPVRGVQQKTTHLWHIWEVDGELTPRLQPLRSLWSQALPFW